MLVAADPCASTGLKKLGSGSATTLRHHLYLTDLVAAKTNSTSYNDYGSAGYNHANRKQILSCRALAVDTHFLSLGLSGLKVSESMQSGFVSVGNKELQAVDSIVDIFRTALNPDA